MNTFEGFLRDQRRNYWTYEELEPYFGMYVIWFPDYTAVYDADTDYAAALARTPANQDPAEPDWVVEYIPDPRVEEAYEPLRPVTPEELARDVPIPALPADVLRAGAAPCPGPADHGLEGVRAGRLEVEPGAG